MALRLQWSRSSIHRSVALAFRTHAACPRVWAVKVDSQTYVSLLHSQKYLANTPKNSASQTLSSQLKSSLGNAALPRLHFFTPGAHEIPKLKWVEQSFLLHSRCHSQDSADVYESENGVQGVRLEGKDYKCIETMVVEQGKVGLIILNRPKVLNALSEAVMHEVVDALQTFDAKNEVGAMVITGKDKAFAAGADIKEMKDKDLVDIYMSSFPAKWNDVAKIQKPIIAAVNGYALGGGCEVAMMCDIVLVGESAVFGQPEINLGTIPGMGGTQRLIREVGKSRSMEMILTGKYFLDAKEACERGLASRIIPGGNDKLLAEAIAVAKRISDQSRPVVVMAKAAVNAAYEMGLQEGVKKEQTFFGATFGLDDQKEGMSAFVEKRKPQFKHK